MDIVLLKFNINPSRKGKLLKAGINQKNPDEQSIELKHILDAVSVGRNPYQFRTSKADSGFPVFGESGIKNVSLLPFLKHLKHEGFHMGSPHIRKRNEKFDSLVIPFSEEKGELSDSAKKQVMELLNSSWEFVHIWTNPQRENDMRIVHTVNCAHRIDSEPEFGLHFVKGAWFVSKL